MNIGIITYWQTADNYGQILQCWALQHFLSKKLGHSPFLIRFKRYAPAAAQPIQSTKFHLCHIVKNLKRILGIILILPYLKDKRRRKQLKKEQQEQLEFTQYAQKRNDERQFDTFRSAHLKYSEQEYSTLKVLQQNPPEADVYITGSDQVWNYDLQPEELAAFFLQFGDKSKKRISYAPSIGHATWPETLKMTLKEYLSVFDGISVREKSALQIMTACGFNATHVLDPTMLLDTDDYQTIIHTKANSTPYIYIYSINYESKEDLPWSRITEYATQHKYAIRVTPGSGYAPAKELFEGVEYDYATIPSWIANIKQAELVITASFHGIVFSILHHKRFIYTPLKGRFAASNARVLDLLEALGLESLILNEDKEFGNAIKVNIHWEVVDVRIAELRKQSVSFIENHLAI